MLVLVGSLARRLHWVVQARPSSSSFATASAATATKATTTYKTVRAHVVHRHGDRTPITPLLDEAYWSKTLIPSEVAQKMAAHTKIVAADSDKANTHAASGRGPFGKLTQLGLLQMIQVGSTLRERFASAQHHQRVDGTTLTIEPLSDESPLAASDLHIYCTNFERTIQSVQGFLMGFLDNKDDEGLSSVVPIDIRHTNSMIPDPQPRQTLQQSKLERRLSERPHIVQREQELRLLAVRATQALSHLLAADAHSISFGVDEKDDESSGSMEIEVEPLGWNQLAEISKCLAVRELLPADLTTEDQEAISKHAAWRWFENLKDDELIFLAMNKMSKTMTEILASYPSSSSEESTDSQRLTIWSAHDSTLIGLLCAFRLQMPAVWPEYASAFVMELIEVGTAGDSNKREYFVRFSMNGEQLNSEWKGLPVMDLMPLDVLLTKLGQGGASDTALAQ
jgi:hypothetical protein